MKISLLIISLYNLVCWVGTVGSSPVILGTYVNQQQCLDQLKTVYKGNGYTFCVYTEFPPGGIKP